MTSSAVAQVLVSQAGGTYIPLYYTGAGTKQEEGKEEEKVELRKTSSGSREEEKEPGAMELVQGEMVGKVSRSSQSSSSTEVVGDLHSHQDLIEGGRHCNTVALCTLDGEKVYRNEPVVSVLSVWLRIDSTDER